MSGDHGATSPAPLDDAGDAPALGLADLVRAAFTPTDAQSSATARVEARDELWARLTPQIDRMCIKVCRRCHPSLRCAGPGRCPHYWCDAARDYLIGELFNPDRPKSLARRMAADPSATDEDVSRWVSTSGSKLWSETRRSLLSRWGLQQRVDVWVTETPHRECLQDVLDEALGDDAELLARLGPTTIDAWAEAFAVDAVQWANDFPNFDRVLRHLGHEDEVGELERLDNVSRSVAHQAVVRVEAAFRTYDEAACPRCGGQPRLDSAARMITAQAALDALTPDIVEQMAASGLVVVDADGAAVVAGPHTAGRILLFADPPASATTPDDQRRPPWFARFVLEPRGRFIWGRGLGAAAERLPDPHVPGEGDDPEPDSNDLNPRSVDPDGADRAAATDDPGTHDHG